MPDLLLAEELLLIALDDEKGTTSSGFSLDPGLAGAVLLDLLAAGSLVETGDALDVDPDAGAPSHQLLADAISAVGAKDEPKKAKYWVDRLPTDLKPLKGRVAASLVSRGVLDEERHKTLGLIPSTRFPQADPNPERELRTRLEAALVHGTQPEPRTARLVALIHAIGLVSAVVPKDQREVAADRAKVIADSSAVGTAVKRAVEEIRAALTVAATTGAVTAGLSI